MNPVWHVVICKPRQEFIALDNLRRQGFHTYLPRIQVRRRLQGRWMSSVQPLFPRYLFVSVEQGVQNTAVIRSTHGAVGLLRFGSEPARVPEKIIDALVAREDPSTGLIIENPAEQYQSGDRVKMLDGALAGIEGIFASMSGDDRVVVLIELLGKTNQVCVMRDAIALAA